MSLKEQALALLAQGFRPIPLGGYQETPPGWFIKRCDGDIAKATADWPKTARVKWAQYQKREPTEEEVEKWWTKWPDANIAILTGFEVYVVDADSDEAIEWVENYLTKTPWRVDTKQGRHYYFAVSSKALDIRNSVGVNAKVDVRGVGGYVVAAGSRHSSGVHYGWNKLPHPIADNYNDLPELTVEDIQRIKHHNESMAQVPASTLLPLQPGVLMANMGQYGSEPVGEAQIEGSRNQECARLAGLYIQQGHALSEALDKCMAWNEKNVPPLPDGEVIRTVQSVSQTHERNTGHPVPLEPPPEKQVESLMFTLGELTSAPPPEPEAFWGHRLLFRGARFMIAGAPKIGKSRFNLALAVQACCGGKFLNDQFQRPLKVMWMQAEIHKAWLLDRVSQVTPSLSSDQQAMVRENLILSGRLDLDLKASERDFDATRKALEQHRPDIWCLDPIINFSSAEENSNVEVQALLRRINQLATDFDCAVILVHHTRKPSQAKHTDFDQIRGASAFRGWFDTGVMLTGEASDPMVSWEARNTESPGAHMAFFSTKYGEYQAHMIETDEQAGEATADNADIFAPQAYAMLERAGGMMTAQHMIDGLMSELRLDENIVRKLIVQMAAQTGATSASNGDGELIYVTPRWVKANK